jgi:hypothetical protein
MSNFKTVVSQLSAANVPCRVKEVAGGNIIVELGFNYPDEMFDQVIDAVGYTSVEVCAEVSGFDIVNSSSVAGGPKRHSLLGRW